SCPLHEPESVVRVVQECSEGRSDTWTLGDLLQRYGRAGGYVLFDWPITAQAVCRVCGHTWEPMIRRARFRRATCPSCGGADLAETDVLTSVSAESPWAGRTLAALGLPRGHVYEIGDDSSTGGERTHVEMTGDLAID